MHVTYKQLIPAACLSVLLGACSSSGGASPDRSDGSTSGTTTDTGGIESDATAGTAGGTAGGTQTGGDTAGTGTDSVGTTGGGADIVGAAQIDILQGDWATGCRDYVGNFERSTLSVVGARMLYEISFFSDQDCTEPLSIGLVVSGTSVQQSVTTVPTGATRTTNLGEAVEVNFHFEQSTVDNKPLEATVPGDGLEARVEFDIVFVLDDALYFGDFDIVGYEGVSPETRPISLNTYSSFNRVQ